MERSQRHEFLKRKASRGGAPSRAPFARPVRKQLVAKREGADDRRAITDLAASYGQRWVETEWLADVIKRHGLRA